MRLVSWLVGWFLSRRKIISLTLKKGKDLLKRRNVSGGKGLPSVITSNTFSLSSLSPALEVNSLSLACSRARSILVMNRLTGSIVLMFSANVNLKRLYLSKVIKPNWVFCAEISNLAKNGVKNVSNKTSSFLWGILSDVSIRIPMSLLQGVESAEIEQKLRLIVVFPS